MKLLTTILIIIFACLFIGAGYRYSLSQYEEVCKTYQMNVTAEKHCRCISNIRYSNIRYANMCYTECCSCPEEGKEYYYTHQYINTGICVEYELVRKTSIPSFNYNFDWCEVYPNSEDCINTS